jgi:hypothetical protein
MELSKDHNVLTTLQLFSYVSSVPNSSCYGSSVPPPPFLPLALSPVVGGREGSNPTFIVLAFRVFPTYLNCYRYWFFVLCLIIFNFFNKMND